MSDATNIHLIETDLPPAGLTKDERADAVLRLLLRGQATFEVPYCWTRGSLARDEHGRPVAPDSPAAVCWCAMGALRRDSESRPLIVDWAQDYLDVSSQNVHGCVVMHVNDRLGLEAVREIYADAVARRRADLVGAAS